MRALILFLFITQLLHAALLSQGRMEQWNNLRTGAPLTIIQQHWDGGPVIEAGPAIEKKEMQPFIILQDVKKMPENLYL